MQRVTTMIAIMATTLAFVATFLADHDNQGHASIPDRSMARIRGADPDNPSKRITYCKSAVAGKGQVAAGDCAQNLFAVCVICPDDKPQSATGGRMQTGRVLP